MFSAFVGLGLLDGGGGVIWPDVIDAFGVSKGLLGLASGFGLAVAFPILVFGGRLADWFDKRSLLAAAFLLIAAAAAGFAALSGAVALFALLIARGLGVSLLDLSNNALAMDYERERSRHIMGPLHAAFSAGGLLGALIVWAAFKAGGDFRALYLGLSCFFGFLIVLALWARRKTGPRSRDQSGDVSAHLALRMLREPVLRSLAIATGFCFAGEVLLAQWVSIYLRDQRDLGSTVAVLAISAYGTAMLIGRLGNGPLTRLFGARLSLITQGFTTIVGGVLIMVEGPAAIAIFGCAVAGFGLAGQAPTALSLAGMAHPRAPGAASGAVLMGGYVGLAGAPFAAGLVATVLSTRAVMAGIAVAGLFVVIVATRLPKLARP
jgi:fucose permease